MRETVITEEMKNEIKNILEKSNYKNPVIIGTKFGFTKFWKDKDIHYSSMGDNWNDKTYSSIEIDRAIEMIARSKHLPFNSL